MLIEQRMAWLDIHSVCLETDIISIGSEACINPFLNIAEQWEKFLELVDSSHRIKIVLPRVAQNELEQTLKLLDRILALQHNPEFVCNDWGIIYFLANSNYPVKIHVGRQLCRSLLDCPWSKEILKNESIAIRRILSSHPYNDVERVSMLKSQKVCGLEINGVLSRETVEFFSKMNLETAIDSDSYLLTCGRTCLSKRIIKQEECRIICEKQIRIEPSGKWINYFEHSKPVSDYERNLFDGMSISGKRVLLPQKLDSREIFSLGTDVVITRQHRKIKKFRRMIS